MRVGQGWEVLLGQREGEVGVKGLGGQKDRKLWSEWGAEFQVKV